MKLDSSLIVANWKMQLSFNEALEQAGDYYEQYVLDKKTVESEIVLCPSFPALFPASRLFKGSAITLGAQDCSPHRTGAYTGQVCAESLAQIGCKYCIIGHSERRHYNHETNMEIADKAQRLLEQEVRPITCIGETKQEYESQETFRILQQQLDPVLERIASFGIPQKPIYISYEPVWSIGTGIIPSTEYLTNIVTWIREYAEQKLGRDRLVGILYGGSVSAQTIPQLKEVQGLSGLLVGGASLNFQKFNNIVYSYNNSLSQSPLK